MLHLAWGQRREREIERMKREMPSEPRHERIAREDALVPLSTCNRACLLLAILLTRVRKRNIIHRSSFPLLSFEGNSTGFSLYFVSIFFYSLLCLCWRFVFFLLSCLFFPRYRTLQSASVTPLFASTYYRHLFQVSISHFSWFLFFFSSFFIHTHTPYHRRSLCVWLFYSDSCRTCECFEIPSFFVTLVESFFWRTSFIPILDIIWSRSIPSHTF